MAAINGTNLLIYSDGVVIAMQKGMSISVDTDLPDATNKESAGWAQHIQGMLNAKIDFTSLFATSVTGGMDATALMNYIISRKSLLISILGLSFPIVAEADLNSLSFDAPQEGSMTLSGSLKVNGQLYCLRDTMAPLVTDAIDAYTGYATATGSGTTITSAVITSAPGTISSNEFDVVADEVFKCAVFITKNSGQVPSVYLFKTGTGVNSDSIALVEGFNFIELTAQSSGACSLQFKNTLVANWLTTPIYFFKVA